MVINLRHRQRLQRLLPFLLGVALCVGLVLYALRQNINWYCTPSEILTGTVRVGMPLRLGGLVQSGSLKQDVNLRVQFVLRDAQHAVHVDYVGVLPALFKEGRGAVALGRLVGPDRFEATEILAKHDENYRPKQDGF